MNLDADKLLQPISDDEPCGPNLEYDAVFGELERAAQGRAEQVLGESVLAAEPPNWRDVQRLAKELLAQTKDLRVLMYLARAGLHTDGLPGLAGVIEVMRRILEQYWPTLHPQLDPDDDNDPTLRVNCLLGLIDQQAMLRSAAEAPLVQARGIGQFSLRDLQMAAGEIPVPEGQTAPDKAVIDAAFMQAPLEELQATADALNGIREGVREIERVLTEQVGSGQSVDLSALPNSLRDAERILRDRLAQRGVESGSPGETAEEMHVAAHADAPVAVRAVSGEITSRDDVIRMLDKICQYFERNEPSSPIPILLQRAKRLVPMSFLDIVRDLAPEGLNQVEVFRGHTEGGGNA